MAHFSEQQMLTIAGFLELGDVPGNLGSPDDPALRVPDRRDGQGYVDKGSILASAQGFEVLNPLAPPDLFENDRFFVLAVGRDYESNWADDRLIRAIAEKPLGALVPAEDHAVEVLGQDGVFGGFDDGGVMLGHPVAQLQPWHRLGRFRSSVGNESGTGRDAQCSIVAGQRERLRKDRGQFQQGFVIASIVKGGSQSPSPAGPFTTFRPAK